MRPTVVVAPSFRSMAEIFDQPTLRRLHDLVDVTWARDGVMPQDAFDDALRSATAVVFGTWHYGYEAVAKAGPELRYLFDVGGGFRHPDLDFATCFARNVRVGSCAPAFGPVVAEMALALSLAAMRLVPSGDSAFRSGTEQWLHAGNVGAVTMLGKTVGFVGAGNLARSLQRLLEPFGVTFLAHDPWHDDEALAERGLQPVDLPTLFAESDVVYVLAVPSPTNHHLVSGELMDLLRPTDVLTVISRAHLVDFDALSRKVVAGQFRAAIDVFPVEPLPGDHPLRQAEGAVLSAHRAGALPAALLEIGRMVVDDLAALLSGDEPTRMQYATPALIDRLQP